jgi:hypothetical protein
MNHRTIAVCSLVLLSLPAVCAAADDLADEAIDLSGAVVSLTDESLVLRTEAADVRLALTARTEQPADLEPGDHVRVWYRSAVEENVVERIKAVGHAKTPPRPVDVTDEIERSGEWTGTATVLVLIAVVVLVVIAARREGGA